MCGVIIDIDALGTGQHDQGGPANPYFAVTVSEFTQVLIFRGVRHDGYPHQAAGAIIDARQEEKTPGAD